MESPQTGRYRYRQLPGRPSAGSSLQDPDPRSTFHPGKRAVHESCKQGTVLPRRAVRDASRCRESLQHPLPRPEPDGRRKAGPRGVSEVAAGTVAEFDFRTWHVPVRAATGAAIAARCGARRRVWRSNATVPTSAESTTREVHPLNKEIGNLESARFPHWKPEISKP